jgi:N-acetylmuramoyl-L-alanine amidase
VAERKERKKVTVRKINYLVVHCSASQATSNLSAKDIEKDHKERGFLSIGYHYVIKRDGTLETGRPIHKPGAHVEGHNHDSIGICLVGGVKKDGVTPENNFTAAQFATLRDILETLQEAFPEAEVLGHRDFKGVRKACPCFDVREWQAGLTKKTKGK